MVKKEHLKIQASVLIRLCRYVNKNGIFILNKVIEYLKINNFDERLQNLPDFDKYFPGDVIYKIYLEEAIQLRNIIDIACKMVADYLQNIGAISRMIIIKDQKGGIIFMPIKQNLS